MMFDLIFEDYNYLLFIDRSLYNQLLNLNLVLVSFKCCNNLGFNVVIFFYGVYKIIMVVFNFE